MAMIETIKRSCPTCEACCGLVLRVDRNKQEILSIKGDPDDPRSRGYVCAKSQAFRYVHEDPERLRRPVKRTATGWQEIDWNEALDLVGSKLKAIRETHGKDSVAIYYGNPNGHNAGTLIYTALFSQMLDTERFFSAGTVDQQPKNVSCQLLYGEQWFFPVPDIDHTDFFICMGGNPVVSQGSIMSAPDMKSRLNSLRQRGGKSVVIDPRRTETAELCDQHLFIKPGSDAFFLFAFINVMFEQDWIDLRHLADFTDGVEEVRDLARPFTPETVASITGITARDLRQLVADYCTADKAVIYGRTGLCTQRFGTLASWLVDVVNILSGNTDRRGGAMFPRQATGQTEPSDKVTDLPYNRFKARSTGFPEVGGQLPASHLGAELDYEGDDRVHALLTLAGNPVLSVPNGKRVREAVDKLDFYVAIDIYINETTSRADVILPPASQLEHTNYDFLFQGTSTRNFACYSSRVFEPDPESREQWWIMLNMLARMFDVEWETLDDLMLGGFVDSILPHVQQDNPDINGESMKALLGEERGFERILDGMLRAGPYGDKFGSREGISLVTLKAKQSVIDLGPLQPALPQLLRTPGKRLRLVHPHLHSDLQRLQDCLTNGLYDANKFLLIGRRHVRDMNSWLHNLHPYVKGKNRCTLIMHPADAERLSVGNGSDVTVRSKQGEAQAPVEISDEIMPGVVSLPHGWGHRYRETKISTATGKAPGVSCNDLIDESILDLPSGTSVVNGAEVEISAAR